MTPSLEPLGQPFTVTHERGGEPALKRRKIMTQPKDESANVVPPHPLGIKPLGNAYGAARDIKKFCGTFAGLPDELLVQLLEYLEASSLLKLGATCKSLYAFTRLEELWKTIFINSAPSQVTWLGSWRSSYLSLPPERVSPVDCSNMFSDILYRPYFCSRTPLRPFTANIPSHNQIPRLENLSVDDFATKWADKPFILTEPVQEWPLYQTWSLESLLERHGNEKFRAEAVDWPLKCYIDYMRNNQDESPMYLFDSQFASRMNLKTGRPHGDYWPADCFGEDLFSVLGDDQPDFRWLIVGPERSGSTFHKDPNATSAWNAVLLGSKYWIMFPSSSSLPPPPGVYVSEDQSEVTSPLSIAEWLLGFHEEARQTQGCLEGICRKGEVLHVPSGWYHLVLNLEPSIAITQNFIPQAHLAATLSFLRDKSEQVSGFRSGVEDPYGLFVKKLQQKHADVLDKALEVLERRGKGKSGAWEELTKRGSPDDHAGFSFGFAGDDLGEDASVEGTVNLAE